MTGTNWKLTELIASRTTRTILVHEWVTGGGLAGCPLPPSWAAEGTAMRRAIAADFAAVDGEPLRVVATLDDRLDEPPGPWTAVRVGAGEMPARLVALAREADLTVLIAPETTGILADLTRRVAETGTRLLGSTADAIVLAGDKRSLGAYLADRGIDTPPCRLVRPCDGLPADADFPAVLKPNDGAGTVDTYRVECAEGLPSSARRLTTAVLQPFVTGRPMSATFLVAPDGPAWLLGIGEQEIAVRDGRFAYRGGCLPTARIVDNGPIREAIASVPGLAGFVGVDFLWDDDRRRTTVLEINPRPTTSIKGLVRLLPPGWLASAWLGAFERSAAGARLLPQLAGLIASRPPVAFDASCHNSAP